LLEKYQRVLQNSNQVILFFSYDQFSASDWQKLRVEINGITKRSKTYVEGNDPKVLVIRPGLIPPLVRSIDMSRKLMGDGSGFIPVESIEPIFSKLTEFGTELAVIYIPKFEGLMVSRIINLATRISSTQSAKQIRKAAQGTAASKGKAAPPAAPTKAKGPDRFTFLCSLMFSQPKTPKETLEMTKLPSLEQLQGQIVGLIEMIGSDVVGTIEGAGREVARTLEGFEKGLEQEPKK
jgi:ribosomal protein L10